MRISLQHLARRLSRLRTYGSFLLVAGAQFLSPAAAADPASKIDPPAWSHHHSKEELQAYGTRATAQEPEKKSYPVIRDVHLRRMLIRNDSIDPLIMRIAANENGARARTH